MLRENFGNFLRIASRRENIRNFTALYLYPVFRAEIQDETHQKGDRDDEKDTPLNERSDSLVTKSCQWNSRKFPHANDNHYSIASFFFVVCTRITRAHFNVCHVFGSLSSSLSL